MALCKVCGENFKKSTDSIVMCNHHKGAVHLGCCMNNCSMDGKPCVHAHGVYDKKII